MNSDDQSIDIVGFSRGTVMAREFANVILRMQAEGEFDAPEHGQPFTIRFMGLFDSVSTSMVDGSATNSCGFLYDYTLSDRIGHVAQAYALSEHRLSTSAMIHSISSWRPISIAAPHRMESWAPSI